MTCIVGLVHDEVEWAMTAWSFQGMNGAPTVALERPM